MTVRTALFIAFAALGIFGCAAPQVEAVPPPSVPRADMVQPKPTVAITESGLEERVCAFIPERPGKPGSAKMVCPVSEQICNRLKDKWTGEFSHQDMEDYETCFGIRPMPPAPPIDPRPAFVTPLPPPADPDRGHLRAMPSLERCDTLKKGDALVTVEDFLDLAVCRGIKVVDK